MQNRDGYKVELSVLDQVDMYEDGGCSVRQQGGWSLFIGASELNGFVPQVGDVLVVYTKGFNTIAGLAIDGRVLRYKTPEQIKAEHEQWVKNNRLEKLERYLEHGDALKARVKNLHPVLQARMERFDKEKGVEFWIDDAPYEMAVLEGAQALLNKTANLFGRGYAENEGTDEDREEVAAKSIAWIDDWWKINSADHDPPYDYKKQMELVPDFGEGHSGNTANAAYVFARTILSGEGDKL